MLRIDRKQLSELIDLLPKRLRVAFAAATAQRQLPNYIRTAAVNPTGNPTAATRILRELWDDAARNAFNLEKLRHDLAVCEALVPDYEKTFEGIEYAEDAMLSLSSALRSALSGGSEEAMWAAERAYSALDNYIIRRFEVDVNAPHAQSYIDSFPIMQAELSRQQADLTELRATARAPGSEVPVIARIKRRAEGDAASFFG